MRTFLTGVLALVTLPSFAADAIPGEVSCDKGVDIAKVKALVKKTVGALKNDQDRVGSTSYQNTFPFGALDS